MRRPSRGVVGGGQEQSGEVGGGCVVETGRDTVPQRSVPRLASTRPGGGEVPWVEMPMAVDALELYRRALEQKISVAPGPIFSSTRKFRNSIRLNCGVGWDERVESALARFGQMARELAAG